MTQPITHFCQFTDEASAKAALPSYWVTNDAGWDWRRGVVDGPVPMVDSLGAPVVGYFLNIGLAALNASLPGLTGAGYGPANHFTLVSGVQPATPQRVFA